jgi:hypothetical protein
MFIGIVSCSDDEKETDYAKEIVGDYKGAITFNGINTPNVLIEVEYGSENKVILKMNQEVAGLQIDIECNSDVKYANNEYNISGTTTFNLVVAAETPAVPVPVTVDGTINKEGTAILNMNVATPSPLTVVFTGTKQ